MADRVLLLIQLTGGTGAKMAIYSLDPGAGPRYVDNVPVTGEVGGYEPLEDALIAEYPSLFPEA